MKNWVVKLKYMIEELNVASYFSDLFVVLVKFQNCNIPYRNDDDAAKMHKSSHIYIPAKHNNANYKENRHLFSQWKRNSQHFYFGVSLHLKKLDRYTQCSYCQTVHFYVKLSYITFTISYKILVCTQSVPGCHTVGTHYLQLNDVSTVFSLQTLQLNNKDIIHQFREIPDSALNFL